MKNPYSRGLEPLAEKGILKPTQDRCLLRAIMATDDAEGGLAIAGVDTKNAMCHEIVAVGYLVKRLRPGNYCVHISTAGDSVDGRVDARYCVVREEDIIVWWDHAAAVAAASGESPLEPAEVSNR